MRYKPHPLWALAALPLMLLADRAGPLVSPSRRAIPDTLWLLAKKPPSDAVHLSDTEATLRARYGAANVRVERVEVGEGVSVPGLVLFPNDSTLRLEVEWGDSLARAKPSRVTMHGAASRWVVFPGVHIGMTLRQVERVNAGPFRLTGFGWDYGGMVTSWEHGRLELLWRSPRNRRAITVRFDASASAAELVSIVSGEAEHGSDERAMYRLNPRIIEIAVAPQ